MSIYLEKSRSYRSPTYRVLAVGVNAGPRSAALRYAEKDASDVADLMSSAVGPISANDVSVLQGATRDELCRELRALQRENPDYFMFYFSGHGNIDGVLLADGQFSFSKLAHAVRAINAEHSLVILDTCHAGAYLRQRSSTGFISVGAIQSDALTLLANATPSNRVMCSTAENRLAGEGHGVLNGHFTAALLRATSTLKGELGGGWKWISDAQIFDAAVRITHRRWRQVPQVRGQTGDFPVVRDQHYMVGAAAVENMSLVAGQCMVTVCAVERVRLPTLIRMHVFNYRGHRLASLAQYMSPTANADIQIKRFPFRVHELITDPASIARLYHTGRVPIRVQVEICDQRGRAFDVVESLEWLTDSAPGFAHW